MLKNYSFSFNVKIAVALFLISLILTITLFLLVVPKMQKEQIESKKAEIEKLISVTKEQVNIAVKAIEMQSSLERSETRYKLEVELNNIKKKAYDVDSLLSLVEKSSINKHCSYYIRNSRQIRKNIINPDFIKAIRKDELNKWNTYYFDLNYKSSDRKSKYYSYTTKFNFDDTKFSMFCGDFLLNINHEKFENKIKPNIQNSFSLIEEFHKGKNYLVWVNPKLKYEDDKPLYEENKEKSKQRYTISSLSSIENIRTGNLSAKQLVSSANKEPLEHQLNGKEAITWVKSFSSKDDSYIFLLVTTVLVDDLLDENSSLFWKILSIAIIFFILTIISIVFILKRFENIIDILSYTLKQVNQGNKSIRTNVKSDDDIVNIAVPLDNLLDSIEENNKKLELDSKERLEKLDSLLKQKDELINEKEKDLKEVHHKVKNSFAFNVGLIKLLQKEVKEKKSKKILKDIHERIYTMQLLHEKFYNSTNLNQIDLKSYVQSLIGDIQERYETKNEVLLDIEIDDINLDIEKAVPFGLVLSELITNSFRYAFNDNEKPQLKVVIKKDEDNILLTIQDNGEGIPDEVDFKSSNSFGLRLVNAIVKVQLEGKVKYKNRNGSFFKIVF